MAIFGASKEDVELLANDLRTIFENGKKEAERVNQELEKLRLDSVGVDNRFDEVFLKLNKFDRDIIEMQEIMRSLKSMIVALSKRGEEKIIEKSFSDTIEEKKPVYRNVCPICSEEREILNPEIMETKTGKMVYGKCGTCETPMYKKLK